LDSQANQILSLEAALLARPEIPPDAPETEKDKLIADQHRSIRELEIVVRGYEDNLGEPLRQVREDVEREWEGRLAAEVKRREEKEVWATELVKQLEKEKKLRVKLEEERRALAAFVSKFDALGLGAGSLLPAASSVSISGSVSAPGSMGSGRVKSYLSKIGLGGLGVVTEETESPMRINLKNQPSLLDQTPEEEWSLMEDVSFEMEIGKGKLVNGRRAESSLKEVLGRKENIPV
jgi:centromeric protein E